MKLKEKLLKFDIHTLLYSFTVGRFNQSLKIFHDVEKISVEPDHDIFHYIGELLYKLAAANNQLVMTHQEEAEAKLYYQKAIQYGKNLKSFQKLAEIHRKAKEYWKAIEVFETCLQ